jgi:hypothetical protein
MAASPSKKALRINFNEPPSLGALRRALDAFVKRYPDRNEDTAIAVIQSNDETGPIVALIIGGDSDGC